MNNEIIALSESIPQIKYIVGIVASSLSLAIILCLFAVYYLRPCSRANVFFRMVIFMEFPNAIYAATGFFIFPEEIGSGFCVISGAIRQYTNLSSSFWSMAIAYHIYSSISVHEIRPFSMFYLLFGYGTPLPFTVVPWLLDMYGPTPIYCGLPYQNPLPNLVIYYFPVLAVFFGTCYFYFSVIKYLRRRVSKEAAQEFYGLFFYPLIVVVYNLTAFIFLLEEVDGRGQTASAEILMIVSTGLLQAQGIFDVVVYAQNYAIREEIKIKLCGASGVDFDDEFDRSFSLHMDGMLDVSKRRNSTTDFDDRTAANTKHFSFVEERTRSSITV